MNIAAYCRVSTDKEDQINSLETQKEFFAGFCERNQHNLVRIYADEGISGTKVKNRKEFQRLMADAQSGAFDAVAVKDISRLARNTVDFLTSIRSLKAMNINTLFLTSNMSVMGDSEFILTIFGAMAQEESANTSKRVKFGKKLNREKGRVPNFVYGYDKAQGDFYNLNVNEREAQVVQRIFRLYTEEGLGTSKIAEILNNQGIQTKRDCHWSQTAVARVLQNEIYTGKLISGKEEVTDFLTGERKATDHNQWTVLSRPEFRIIEEEMFTRAQQLMTERSHNFSKKKERHSSRHPFSTLIKCSHCGRSFKRITSGDKARWVCSTRNLKGKQHCENTSVVYEEQLLWELQCFIDSFSVNKIKLAGELCRQLERQNELPANKEALEKQINQIHHKRRKYLGLFEEDIITKDELKREYGNLEEKKASLQNQLAALDNKPRQRESYEVKKIMEKICLAQELSNPQYKNFIEKIQVSRESRIDIRIKPLDKQAGFFPISNNHT